MNAHERAQQTETLHLTAQALNLRNRRIAPERGWRLIDVLGAPQRAITAGACWNGSRPDVYGL